MTDRDRFDIDGSDDLYAGENFPGHIVNPDAWQARPSAGANLAGIAGIVAAVLLVAACIVAAVMGGWR